MFGNCFNITSIIFGNFNTESAEDLSYLFQNCENLKYFNENFLTNILKFHTNNVTNMSGMFRNCNQIKDITLFEWDVSKVINMENMFYNCQNLNYLYGLTLWDINNVKNMDNMFANCFKLILSLDWIIKRYNNNIKEILKDNKIFRNCKSLKNYIQKQ